MTNAMKELDTDATRPEVQRGTGIRTRRTKTIVGALVLTMGLLGVGAQAASAASSGFTHYMPGSNVLYWFSPVYNHSAGGSISIQTNDIPTCGASTNVGLWSPQTGNQFTNSLTFVNDSSSGTFVNSASGSTYIAPLGFSMDARRGGACNPSSSTDPIVRFQGTLNY
ncbi:hypothetical protein [Agromyces sp. NPDC049794]|uniref:hypothetical protein n=1 Tax=unclassified Agromyces TaxID=2639701 RepID=UPI0033CF8274